MAEKWNSNAVYRTGGGVTLNLQHKLLSAEKGFHN